MTVEIELGRYEIASEVRLVEHRRQKQRSGGAIRLSCLFDSFPLGADELVILHAHVEGLFQGDGGRRLSGKRRPRFCKDGQQPERDPQ